MHFFLKAMLLEKLRFVLKLSRPRFWLYLAGPFLIGAVSINSTDFSTTTFSVMLYGFLYFLIPANIILYGINDYFDFDTDKFNKKKLHQELFLNSPNNKAFVKRLIIVCTLLALPLFYYLNLPSQVSLILFFILSFGYSMPPLRFKTRVFLDSISNVLYVLPGLISYQYSLQFFPPTYVIIACCLWAIAMHLFSAIPDIEPDKKAGLQTTAVFLGMKKSLLTCSLLWFLAALIMNSHLYILLVGILYSIIPLAIYFSSSLNSQLNTTYWRFPYINGFFGLSIFIYVYYWI